MKISVKKRITNLTLTIFLLAGLFIAALPIVLTTTPVSAASCDIRVAASADDCMVSYDSSTWTMYLTQNHWTGYHSATYSSRGGGERFLNVPIPQGATITTAYITFTAAESDSLNNVNSVLIGYDVDDAGTFSTIADYQAKRGTSVGGANDDYITTASVNWNSVAAWTAESTYDSPEIKTIIQEIVDRSGWSSGNDMVIFWDDHDDNSTHTDLTYRLAYSYDADTTKAPLLHVEWEDPGAEPIDVGSTVSDRASTTSTGVTYINLENPVNADGKVTSVEVWSDGSITAMYVGSFYNSGSTFTCRDWANLGAVSSGDQTITSTYISQDLSLYVKAGDYLGFYTTGSTVSYATSGGSGMYTASGNYCRSSYEGTFSATYHSGWVASIYGTGGQLNLVGSDPTGPSGGGCSPNYTRLDTNNRSDKSGTIESIEVNTVNNLTQLIVGTFYGSGYQWTNRDYESCGAVSSGTQTVTSLDIDVEVGDILGYYFTTASDVVGIREPSGAGCDGSGVLFEFGNWLDGGGPHTFQRAANTRDQIQATITVPGLPIVTTEVADDITTTSVTLNGTVETTGGYDVTEEGFYWGLTTGYGEKVSSTGTFGAGAFDEVLSGLASGTTYHFQAFATNSQGTDEGEDMTFTTSSTGSGTVTPYPGYSYAQQFTILGSTGGAKYNVNHQLHIYKGTGSSSGNTVYLGSHCANWPNDIIFTSTNGSTLIDFWVESSTTSEAYIWLQLPYVPAYPNTTYAYISYGNSQQTVSLSDGDATFTFFEDFSGEQFDEYDSNPVIDISTYCGADAMLTTHTTVKVNGVWHTYGEVNRVDSESDYPYGGIFHFTSTDFENWVIDTNNPVLMGDSSSTWYKLGFADPSVTYKDGLFYMWLPGNNYTSEPGEKPDVYFGGFTSTDGSTWTELYGDVWPHPHMFSDTVVAWDEDAQLWRAWIVNWDPVVDLIGQAKVMYFTSTDSTGATWNFDSWVECTLSGYHPMPSKVWEYDSTWYMLYFNSDSATASNPYPDDGRIVIASSTDFVHWTTVKVLEQDGYDPDLVEDPDAAEDTWYLTYAPSSEVLYDQPSQCAYFLYTLEGANFLEIGGSGLGDSWIDNTDDMASIVNGNLVIDKTSDANGVEYASQLPATCVVGFKIANLQTGNHYAGGELLNKAGDAQQVATFVEDAGAGEIIAVYIKSPEHTETLGSATVGTWYYANMRIESTTQVVVNVQGYDEYVAPRTACTNDFLYFGVSDSNAYLKVDNVYIGVIVSPAPTISSWSGGSSDYSSVVTGDAEDITLNSATLYGYINHIVSGNTITYYGFDYGLTSSCSSSTVSSVGDYGLGSFNLGVSSLTGQRLYYYRAKIYDDDASAWRYGAPETFTTGALTAPIVYTNTVANKTTTSATLQGTLTSMGDYSIVYVSFEWGPSPTYGYATSEVSLDEEGAFSADVSGLTPGVIYYYRAKVRYGTSLTSNGSPVTFTTSSGSGSPTISPPDLLQITSVQIYRDYLEDDDEIFLIAYKIVYTEGNPVQLAEDYFRFQVLDGDVLVAQTTVPYWGYRPGSIYLSAEGALEWRQSYTVKLVGASSMWANPPEANFDVSDTNYKGEPSTIMDTWCLNLADSMGTFDGTTYTTSVSGFGTVLNDTGSAIFAKAIPGLQSVRENLFGRGTRDFDMTDGTEDRGSDYADSLDMSDTFGQTTTENLEQLGGFLGLGADAVGGVIWFIVMLLIVGGIVAYTRSPVVGILVCLPMLFVGNYLGVVDWSITGILGVGFAIYLSKKLWLEST